MSKELEALNKWLKEYLHLCEKLNTNQQEKMLLDTNSPYNILKQAIQELEDYRKVMVTPIQQLIEELKQAEENKEILDIIKKNIFIVPSRYDNPAQFNEEYISLSMSSVWNQNKEEYKKVKEWLECPTKNLVK